MPPKKVKSVESSDSEELFPPPDPPKRPKEAEKSKADPPKPPKARVARKASAHPSTMEMVKEALKALDSRKGSSAQAIRGYILDKYPSVDAVRLKYMLRKALTKGIESGDLVRPANSSGNGAQGRFRIPAKSKTKEIKAKASENTDPNAGRALKAEKAAVKTSKVQEGHGVSSGARLKKGNCGQEAKGQESGCSCKSDLREGDRGSSTEG
ncbi:hypothetical protein Z043_123207 [Scleropages formosus]|uniref:H15 domain-containing protein n=1 Tax=Scleropages formosus TaxID=113540 RepID=A0A0P7TXS7_SCLFO|nr:hypothetical protein Z043_123207 [Scleropages formosus]